MAEQNDRYCGDCLNLTLERKEGVITGSHLCVALNQYRSEWQRVELCSSFKTARMVAEEIISFIGSYFVTTVHSEGNMHHIDDREWQSVKQRLRDKYIGGK